MKLTTNDRKRIAKANDDATNAGTVFADGRRRHRSLSVDYYMDERRRSDSVTTAWVRTATTAGVGFFFTHGDVQAVRLGLRKEIQVERNHRLAVQHQLEVVTAENQRLVQLTTTSQQQQRTSDARIHSLQATIDRQNTEINAMSDPSTLAWS